VRERPRLSASLSAHLRQRVVRRPRGCAPCGPACPPPSLRTSVGAPCAVRAAAPRAAPPPPAGSACSVLPGLFCSTAVPCGSACSLFWCCSALHCFAVRIYLLLGASFNSVLAIFTMAQISPIVINITLDGSNYPEWSFCVETALRCHGLYSHLTDDPPKSDGNNASIITTWQINDGKVMAAMVNSIKQSMIMSLRKFKTAKQIWSALKQRYVQDSGALLHNLMQQIHVIEQGDMSIDDYYSAYDRLMGSLTSMVNECTAADCPAHKFIERFLTYRFVMGVKPEFDSIRTRCFIIHLL